jgi:cellobiose-specific phosphotransferase system component IIA
LSPAKKRLVRLIEILLPKGEARRRCVERLDELSDEEADDVAQDIEDILNATPAGQEAIRKFVAQEQAMKRNKKPPS